MVNLAFFVRRKKGTIPETNVSKRLSPKFEPFKKWSSSSNINWLHHIICIILQNLDSLSLRKLLLSYCTVQQWTINMHVTICFIIRTMAHKKIMQEPLPRVSWDAFVSLSLFFSPFQCPTCVWQNCNRDLGNSWIRLCEHVSVESLMGTPCS